MKHIITSLLVVFASMLACAQDAAADPSSMVPPHMAPPPYLMFIEMKDAGGLIVYEQSRRRNRADPTLLTVLDSKPGTVANIWVEVADESKTRCRFKMLKGRNPVEVLKTAKTLLGITSDDFVIRYRARDDVRVLMEVSDHKVGAAKAADVSKRVIADKSPAMEPGAHLHRLAIPGLDGTLIEGTTTFPSPQEMRRANVMKELEAPMKGSQELVDSYMLGNDAPEKLRIAYAQAILASKIERIHSEWLEVKRTQGRNSANQMDLKEFDAYLEDAQILAARFAEIGKAEQDAAVK